VRDLAHVDFRRQVPQDRLLEGLVRPERAARQGPRAAKRIACALPKQHLERVVPHLEHRREGGMSGEL
jgi:hypothetical protein